MAVLLVWGPAPGDAPVHLYRTFLVRHGTVLWDNFWYEGDYPLASYSLLYYLPAAAVGNLPLVAGSALAATILFGSIVRRQWGGISAWPARAFGVCAAAPMFTGLYSYSLGVTTLLGAVRAVQARRIYAAVALAALTLGFSPLAFAFLCLVLISIFLAARRLTMPAATLGTAVALLAGFEVIVLRLFPSGGTYPFHLVNLAAVLGVCTVGTLLARHAREGALLVTFFALWGATSILVSLVPTPIGGNWTRLNEIVFPLMLLTASLTRFRPRRLAAFALASALAYNVTPALLLVPYRLDNRPAEARFWQPALRFLQRHSGPGFRVEVVPTAAHWEAYWIPRGGFALARGWYRQLDVADNPALYSKGLDAGAYRSWLRAAAVEYVLLPSTRLDPFGAPREASLLESRASGLVLAYRDRIWTIYRLPHATPLLTGPGQSRVVTFDHASITGVAGAPGRYLLRVHYTRYWQASANVCVRRAPGQMTWLDVAAAGAFSLEVVSAPAALVAAVKGQGSCKSGLRRLARVQHH
jgi:hypothetical protein